MTTKAKATKNKQYEIRTFNFEFKKTAKTPNDIIIEGRAAVFNSPSDSGGLAGFMEVIRPGAFKDAITTDDIRALFNHDKNYVLGRNTAGTLELFEDAAGLGVKITAPQTTWARDLATSMERGDITQMSFAFIPRDTKDATGNIIKGDAWNFNTDPILREIKSVQLFDVSIVTYPFYEDTCALITAREAARETKPEPPAVTIPGATAPDPPVVPVPTETETPATPEPETIEREQELLLLELQEKIIKK